MGDGDPATTPGSYVRDCTIEEAHYGTMVMASNWTLGGATVAEENHYRGCMYGVLAYNTGGAYVANGNTLRNLHIEGCTYGIALWGADDTTIEQVLVHDLAIDGVGVDVDDSSTGVQVTNVTIADAPYAEGTGVLFEESSSGTVKNTVIRGVNGGGVRSDEGGSVDVLHYLGYGTDGLGHELSGISRSDVKAVWSNPRLNGNYSLQSTSPALDLGDSTDANDPDGSRRDLGRFGGTDLAGTAVGSVMLESYYVNGGVDGWAKVPGTAGTWSGNSSDGTYRVTNSGTGVSRAHRWVDASEYTIEARLRFSAEEGKVIFHQADQNESWRLDLMERTDRVRLCIGGVYHNGPYIAIGRNTWYYVRLEIANGTVTVYVDKSLIHDQVSLNGVSPDGHIGVGSYDGKTSYHMHCDYVVVLNGSGSGGGDGSVLLDENFNDGNAKDGNPVTWTDFAGTWQVEGGQYVMDYSSAQVNRSYVQVSGNAYSIDVDLRVPSQSKEAKVINHRAHVDEAYRVDVIRNQNVFRLSVNGVWHNVSATIHPSVWYHVRVGRGAGPGAAPDRVERPGQCGASHGFGGVPLPTGHPDAHRDPQDDAIALGGVDPCEQVRWY